MKSKTKMTKNFERFTLEYLTSGRVITITKYTDRGESEAIYLLTKLKPSETKKLCVKLYVASATPCCAKELAIDILQGGIK